MTSEAFSTGEIVRLKRKPQMDPYLVRYTLDVRVGDHGRVFQVGTLGNGKPGAAVTFTMGTMWVATDDLERVKPQETDV